ncbi:hypothetical protein IJZ97_04590 [bacterium]|nr:hypothetical protein [bacterium]
MITKNGVCYDLTKSIYKLRVGELTFVFSSQLHLDKFKAKLQENRDIINYSLSRRFGITVDVSQLADIVLYKKIETRGFLVVSNEGNNLWQNNLTFVGGKATTRNSNG